MATEPNALNGLSDSQMESLLNCADVCRHPSSDDDRRLFDRLLQSFVPPCAFDAHAHFYDLTDLVPGYDPGGFANGAAINHSVMERVMKTWMGDRVITDGLYFPFPVKHLNCDSANAFLARALKDQAGSRGLMIIRPEDDPAHAESVLTGNGFSGFKVYHVFASREATFLAEQHEFLPEWAWELAHRHSAAIMMHMVLPTALEDARNQTYIREHCLAWPNAKLILAHAARGFNGRHTVNGIDALRGLPNVWFDTSAVCEPSAFEAIIRAFGTTRLMYGSDFPVSELRGRAIGVGDGFYWLHDHNAQWDDWKHGRAQRVGLESLLALQQACRTMHLNDSDIERIFSANARQMLGIECSNPAEPEQTDVQDVQQLYRDAKRLIPGGTQLLSKRPEMFAPGQWPAYFEQAVGCEVTDTDGRRYVDMSHCGILSCILGFADPDVNAAVIRRINLGSMCTQQTSDEVELARLLCEIHPWADNARFARSGGEAMAIAVRIARATTGKSRLAVCGYHGWHDWYMAANLQQSDAAVASARQLDAHLLPGLRPDGVPRELTNTVSTFRYNRAAELEGILADNGDELAAIVMEPTRSVDPDPGFLEFVRQQATARGIPLIFDEISAGWRSCLGGSHLLFGVDPDIAVFAKALSNGIPMAAVIGRRNVMQACQTSFISSTYWTEGIGPAAALATIRKMQQIDVPEHLRRIGTLVMNGWRSMAAQHELPVTIGGRPASCSLSFNHSQNAELLTLLTTRMLNHGFLAAGNCSLTLAHQEHHIRGYLRALDDVFAELAEAIASDDIARRLLGPVKHGTFARLAD